MAEAGAQAVHAWRRGAIVPLTAWAVAVTGWQAFPAGVAVNVVFALVLSAVAVGLTMLALWRGLRSPR